MEISFDLLKFLILMIYFCFPFSFFPFSFPSSVFVDDYLRYVINISIFIGTKPVALTADTALFSRCNELEKSTNDIYMWLGYLSFWNSTFAKIERAWWN